MRLHVQNHCGEIDCAALIHAVSRPHQPLHSSKEYLCLEMRSNTQVMVPLWYGYRFSFSPVHKDQHLLLGGIHPSMAQKGPR